MKTLNQCTMIAEDNESAVKLAAEGGKQKFSRHYSLEFYALKESVALGEIAIKQIPGDVNPADFLTKCLGKILYNKYREELMGDEILQGQYREIVSSSHMALAETKKDDMISVFSAIIFDAAKTMSEHVTQNYIVTQANVARVMNGNYDDAWRGYRDMIMIDDEPFLTTIDSLIVGACENEKYLYGLYM